MATQGLPPLIEALQDPARYPHPAERVELLQTHISWVLLAGPYAYKIKKPANLGFLDFGSLEARRHYCEEELRLNRRTAPDLYLDVLAISGTPADPRWGGDGEAIEFAVRMRRFDQDALLDRLAKRGGLTSAHIDALAREIAQFHSRIAAAGAQNAFGEPEHVLAPAVQNFDQMEALLDRAADRAVVADLREWTQSSFAALRDAFAQRKRGGFVRECHGDLHLGNITLLEGRPVPFDCIEFNEELRWIDVMNEIAFLVMDLHDHRLPELARRCLNAYLEISGDYGGLRVLRFYEVYRAMVRAKIACIRARQGGIGEAEAAGLAEEFRNYLALAQALARPERPALVITHGLSGSGKTTVAQAVLEATGAIRVRSDVERKRLHGLAATERVREGVGMGLYTPAATRLTYERLAALAAEILGAEHGVIVDAAFLRREERERFRALAREHGAPFAIASCDAPREALRERVADRERAGADASDATLAVLERQIEFAEPLAAEELRSSVAFSAVGSEDCLGAALALLIGKISP